jgi:hypothetical protein
VTNWGGGLKGTGVPFALRKFRTDHPIKNKANEKIGKAKMIESGLGNISVIPNNLSTCKAIMTKENITSPKKKAPRGVKRFLVFLLLVAKLYKISIHLVFSVIILIQFKVENYFV